MLDAISEFLDTYLRGSWLSLVDILLVAIVIYWIFILIRGTRAVRIVIGLSFLYFIYLVAQAAQLRLLSNLLQTGAVVGLFAIVVVFQPELRRALEQIGRFGSFNRFFVSSDVSGAERIAREISRAARLLAGSRHGALIVLERDTGLQDLATDSGVPMHADLRAELLATIFYHGTALHDGAVIVSGEKIIAAAVLLPLSQNVLDSERYGTRHRAAIGISEQTDAIVVVVSEETGSISLVMRGRIERNLTEEQLRRRIFNLIRPQAPRQRMPLLRRSMEGRWQVGPEAEPDHPIDPDARVVADRLGDDRRATPTPAPDQTPAQPGEPPPVPAERRS
ncbi:MAG TPA: diadenylate cyclase CdaA [Candidatus Dormibacteraeota bacterium]|nr:diadenylate cyclase CdaA [Candidatus Dormibacteraeota bacterium]